MRYLQASGQELPQKMTASITKLNRFENKRDQYAHFSDDKLLNLVAEYQDREAFAGLYYRYKSVIGCFLQRNCGPKLVEELYNDVMLLAWNKAKSFKSGSKVSTWLFTIAYRSKLAHSRKEGSHKLSGIDQPAISAKSGNGKCKTEPSPFSEALHAAMIELTLRRRTVIELFYFYGCDRLEIESIVDCSNDLVKTLLVDAREQLKRSAKSSY